MIEPFNSSKADCFIRVLCTNNKLNVVLDSDCYIRVFIVNEQSVLDYAASEQHKKAMAQLCTMQVGQAAHQ